MYEYYYAPHVALRDVNGNLATRQYGPEWDMLS